MIATASSSVRRLSALILLPKEHGAYGQLLFPMATALAIGDRSGAAVALAVACAAAFVGHESVLMLLGHRGGRAARQRRADAIVSLACCGALAAATGAWALVRMTPASRVSLVLPVVFALVLLPFIWSRREHSTAGEILAALALSACGVPIARAGGVPAPPALTCWLVFAVCFTVATLAVRSTIALVRTRAPEKGPGPLTTLLSRGLAPISGAGAVALSLVGSSRGWIPPTAALALLPVCGLAVGLSLFPPHPRHLRTVGWSLVTATALTAIVLAVAPL